MWRKYVKWKKSPHDKCLRSVCDKFLLISHTFCFKSKYCVQNKKHVKFLMFCRVLCCFVAKSLFYAIYAVLSRNLFCRYLRALAWRKIGPKILSVELKGQISGMHLPWMYKGFGLFSLSQTPF